MAYAIIEIGGQQYRVEEGTVFEVPHQPAEVGAEMSPDRVLVVSDDDKVDIGTPEVKGAKVTLKVLAQTKGRKIRVFKYHPKENYRRTRGQRQELTELRVEKITLKGDK